MKVDELDTIEQVVLSDSNPYRSRLASTQRKLELYIEQSQPLTADRYSKGFIDGLKYALSLIAQ